MEYGRCEKMKEIKRIAIANICIGVDINTNPFLGLWLCASTKESEILFLAQSDL